MDELTLKIESESPEELIELQEYMLAEYPDLIINENYKHEPGANKEPILISVIIALGGKKILESVQHLMDSYWKHKLATQKEADRHSEEMYKLSLKSKTKNYRSITKKDFMEITIS
jgi:hypothetical protein